MQERVLVIPRSHFEKLGSFQGFTADVQNYLPTLLEPSQLSFRPRGEVETDPSYQQIIPYLVLRHRSRVFYYVRGSAGTEARLQQMLSIGVGGHVSEEDVVGSEDLYRQGLLRELSEEVNVDSEWTEHCIGLINDDSTPVGAVHLGIVHVIELEQPHVQPKEAGLVESGFGELSELAQRRDSMESWSQFALDAITEA